MLECNTLGSVISDLQKRLPITEKLAKKKIVIDLGLMKSSDSLNFIGDQMTEACADYKTKIVGLLFSHPGSSITKAEIIPNLTHYHLRSELAVNFYCIGYGANWPEEHFVDQTIVANVGDQIWYFSENAFSDFIDHLQKSTNWEYQGESVLVLLTAFKNNESEVVLDYQTALVCNLEAMLNDKAITSVRAFFNAIFKFANKTITSDLIWELSDLEGKKIAKNFLKDSVLGLLPKEVSENYRKAEHLAVKDISKPLY
jgi:hypothetical protein